MEISIEILMILFFVGLSAGIIDTIAGGGGLLTIPALLWAGLPPVAALATNKLQSVFGTFSASFYFVKKKLVDLKQMKFMIFFAFLGSFAGSFVITRLDSSMLEKFIPILLIGIGVYFLAAKNSGEIERHKLISTGLFGVVIVSLIGFYDGFFGPGTGSFFAIAFIYLLGYHISKATAHTKVLNFVTNFASLLFFLIYGDVYFTIGLVMGIGQIFGAVIGAKLVIHKGHSLIRPLIVVISFVMSLKLLFS